MQTPPNGRKATEQQPRATFGSAIDNLNEAAKLHQTRDEQGRRVTYLKQGASFPKALTTPKPLDNGTLVSVSWEQGPTVTGDFKRTRRG